MKNKITRIVATILVAAIIMGVIPAIRAAPPPAPAVWITPEDLFFDTAHNGVGDKFNVTIWMSTTGLSYVWQVKVNFNASQINAVRADYTGSGKSEFFTGHGTIPVTPTIDNTTGFVVHGESLVGSDSVPAGSNSLFWIEFRIMAAPQNGETLSSLISVEDSAAGNTFILDPDLNTIQGVNVGSAAYSFSPPPPVRDLAVTDLSLSNDHPKQGQNVTITIVVLNNGTITESFPVEISLDSSMIGTLQVDSLAAGNSQTLTLEWNTTSAPTGKHTITAEIEVVPGDTDSANNAKSKPITILSATGPNTDLNGDGKVDMKDIAVVAQAFGTKEGDARWNSMADVNLDGVVNLFDVALVAKDFWKQ